MNTNLLIALTSLVITFIFGFLSKKSKWINNNLIPLQNLIIGFIVAIIHYIITKNFSLSITVSGLLAGGTYDIIHNLKKINIEENLMTLGIDISTYQNGINLENAKNEGVDFVIIRGSYTGYLDKSMAVDDRFNEHYNNALKNNLNIGIYHFSRATSYEEGKKEAEFLYNNCLKNKKYTYPIFIDVEDTYYQTSATKEQIDSAIEGFCEYIESIGGYAGVYCNLNFANNHMNYDILSKKYDFWLAYWGQERPSTNKYGDYGIWQFGGNTNEIRSNRIDNIVCDQNYSFKDYKKIMEDNNLNDFTEKKEENEKTTKIFDRIFELIKKTVDYIFSKFFKEK